MSHAQLIHGRPDLISIIFLDQRMTISRTWFDKVTWMARTSQENVDKALAKRRAGELCELDEEYWKR